MAIFFGVVGIKHGKGKEKQERVGGNWKGGGTIKMD